MKLLAETCVQRHREQVSKVVLHGETLVSVTTAIVAEEESGSTFGEICLATEVQKFHEIDHVTRCNAY